MRILFFATFFLMIVFNLTAQNRKSAELKLPDPLLSENGITITKIEEWKSVRRPEILEMVKKLMYGISPEAPDELKFIVFDQSEDALKGKAIRKQVAVYIPGKTDYHLLDLLIYLPKNIKPAPVFLGLNFQGNHAVNSDPKIRLSDKWVWIGAGGSIKNHPTEKSRGAVSSRWPIEMILKKGYGVATVYAGDLDPDYFDDFKNGIHALYPELQNREDNFSTMGAWAWGLSRCMDYFETDEDIDSEKIAVLGFSRMGKAAIWAGAKDQRFGMVISNESGGGGAALSKRKVGEDLARLNNGNRHWFSKKFKEFNLNEEKLPFDQHMVLSLIAPRPVYIASAEVDPGSDPEGEFLSAKLASPVYNLFGITAFSNIHFPEVNRPMLKEGMGYHIRSGTHDITKYDWEQFLKFADLNWK
ncbi:glucuronyl esterase domain-containing protein [Zunongwangia sp. HRR-M8]|uniref:glucuronyl esterase domain-containing protein n=1 Tax=Zunongwangia sp. HRR-M8 TaxID=3015170 RepID=UPI0022DD7B9C|nr:acetylxylan esterase [Zunongwangia sp. HRR-M8]WBL23374.1 acetylxylan esterase [Zunongwangia sp. HRR-M8]